MGIKQFLLILIVVFLLSIKVTANDTVSLQLAWKHQFQFSGYYMAKEKGFYSDAGLSVNIKEFDNGIDVTNDVVDAKSDFGIGRSSLIYDRYNDKPVVMLGAIFQHSPVVLLSKKRDDIVKIEDLKNKKIMLTPDQIAMASINAMLQSRKISPQMYTTDIHSFNVQDLIDGKTDVMLSYISNEPYEMEKQNIEYTVFSPRDYNFDFYSDILFTSQVLLEKNPQLVKDFRAASLKGWEYAIENKEETVELILKKYNTQGKTKEALLYEANAIEKLINKDEIELGNIDPKRIEFITQIYSLMGLIKEHKSIDDLVYKVQKSTLELTDEEQNWIDSHRIINVASETDYAPWDFTIDSKPSGYSIDYIKLLAKKAGLKLNFITDKWDNLISKAQSGEIDLIHTMYKNKTHKNLLFVAPYKKVIIGMYTHENNSDVQSVNDLSKKIVSIPLGDSTAQGLEQTIAGINFKFTDGYIESLKDVAFAKADVAVMDMSVAEYLIKQNTIPNIKIVGEVNIDEKLIQNQYYLAVNKQLPILASILKKAMSSVTNDEEKQISSKWITGSRNAKNISKRIELTTQEQEWISAHTVRIGVEQWEPVIFSSVGKDLNGISGDFTNKLIEKTGLKVEVVNDNWDTLLKDFKGKKLDLLPATYYTDKRAEFGLYSDAYFKMKDAIYLKDTNQDISQLKDLEGKTLAIQKGYGTIDKLQKKFPKIKLVLTKDLDDSINKVLSGKVTAFYEGHIAAETKIKNELIKGLKSIPIKDFKASTLHYFSNIDEPILHSIIQKSLNSLSYQEKNEIISKWSSKNNKVIFTNKEQEWLDKKEVINYVYDPDWAPFEWTNELGEHTGIISDILKLISANTGIELKAVHTNKWEESVAKMEEKSVDMYSAVAYNEKRAQYTKFTSKNIYTSPGVMLIRKNDDTVYLDMKSALENKAVGLVKAYAISDYVEQTYPNLKFISLESVKEGFEKLQDGDIDAFMLNASTAQYYIKEKGFDDIRIASKIDFDFVLKIAIQKNMPEEVLSILDKAIDSISEKELSDIYHKWTQVKVLQKVDYTLLYKVATGAFIILLLFIAWNRKMAQEIDKRKEIENQLQESSARMSTLFDASPDSISIIDANGNYVDCNQATLEMFGMASKEEFLKLKPHNLSPELQYNNLPSSEVAQKEIAIAFEKGINKFEWQHQRVDTGGLFDTEVLLSLVSLENKPHIYGVVRDITKTKKAQKELKEIQDKQKSIIENKVKELTLEQRTQLETIERSNKLLSGRENKMVELKSEINEYALKLGIQPPYVIVDDPETNLVLQSEDIKTEIDVVNLLDIPKLQLLLEDFHSFMGISLAIIDLEGNVLAQSKWSRACTDFHRANTESCKRCLESDIDISHKLEEGKDFSVYKCKNGLIDCAAPIIVDGQHLANFFIGQFLIEKPDVEFFKNQAKFFGYDVDDYVKAIKDTVVVSEEKLPHILGFLREITEIIATLSTEKLNLQRQEKSMSEANIASMNLAEDAQEATKEIETYKNHLEDLVGERTDELNSQKEFVQTLIDSQEQLIITTDGETLLTANETFLDFFAVDSVENFKEVYGFSCVCESFNTNAPNGYLQVMMENESWIDYVIARSFGETHKTMITRGDTDFIFSVSATKLPGKERLKSAVFTNITEMENAKQEVENINKHTRESIEYASLIQSALIPDNKAFKNYFQDYFAIWHPKDIVGGDIYLFEELRDKDECLLMVIDCTGHGVPGAFVTMLVKAIERQIIAKINNDLTIDVSPAWILAYFNRKMKTLLRQDNVDSISNAGFDGGIIYFNKKEKILKFAGAETALFYVEDKELTTIKGSRHSIGYKKSDPNFVFKDHVIEVKEGMQFYCTTDGYVDQNGGEKGFPFSKKRFTNLLKECHRETMTEQQEILLNDLLKYQDDEERNDDVTLVGFQI